ncbi:MAG: ROK family protein [Anaerolineae bacterium]|jgi:glucokinase
MTREQLVIGIDLGGTKINTALANGAGRIIARDYRETLAPEGPDTVIARMLDAASRVMAEADVEISQVTAVGICAPGPLDVAAGVVVSPPNLPGWDRVPLRQLIADALGIPAFLEKDANAAAMGECLFGAGRGTQHMIYVTVSTGIGSGLILDGKLYHGATSMAGEIGHTTIVPDGPLCGCGNYGCLEALASGTAIARRARERVAKGAPTLIGDLAEGDPERVTAKTVAQAATQGDIEAQQIISEAMDYLGIGIANLVNLFNPQVIIIGGGLANIGDALFEPVQRVVERRAFHAAVEAVRVVPAELGDDVGVLGAAAVALAQIA